MQVEAKLIFEINETENIRLRVQGTSMEPFLFNGRDTVVLEKAANVRKGDVVVFRYHGNYVMHRVVEINGDLFTALGDNLSFPEKDVPVENIVSKVIAVTRNGKELKPDSPLWFFFSHIYVKKTVRKIFLKIFRLLKKIKNGSGQK